MSVKMAWMVRALGALAPSLLLLGACALVVVVEGRSADRPVLKQQLHVQNAGKPDRNTRIQRPDLSVTWASDFGPISFREGVYEDRSKLIRGSLQRIGGQMNYEGEWGRPARGWIGPIHFAFSEDGASFTGRYLSMAGDYQQWSGHHWPGLRIARAPERDRPSQSTLAAVKPDLSPRWRSDFGRVNVRRGIYGDPNNTLNGQPRRNTDA